MTDLPKTQYAKLGEDPIAYQVFGDGEFDFLHVPRAGVCIELYWDYPPTPTSSVGWANERGSSPSIGAGLRHRTPLRARGFQAGNSGRTMRSLSSMPAKQGFGLDEEPSDTPATKEPAESGEQGSIAGPQRRAIHLTSEHRHLVAEHDDFDRQFFPVTPEEPE